MSNYLAEVRYSCEWDGDAVTLIMEPLTKADMVKMGATPRTGLDIYEVACDVLAKRLHKVEGLRNRNGEAITKEEVLERTYFMGLITDGFAKLVEASILGKATGTSSEQPLPAGSGVPQ